MKYYSSKAKGYVEMINAETVAIDDVLEAYNYLFEMSDSDGAFPGSKEWRIAEGYDKQLKTLVAARPEIIEYRKQIIDAKRKAALANSYID